jgi:hypothetical protein
MFRGKFTVSHFSSLAMLPFSKLPSPDYFHCCSKPLCLSIIIAIQFVVTMACGAMARHAMVARGAMVVPIMFADARFRIDAKAGCYRTRPFLSQP